MHSQHLLRSRLRQFPRALSLRGYLVVCLGAGLLCCPRASAQERPPLTLRLGGVVPAGVRTSATEKWGAYEFNLTNFTDRERSARVLVLFDAQPDVQYGRDVWVPPRATLSTWMVVGPVPPVPGPHADISRDLQILLYDRTDAEEHLLLPPGEERIRSRGVIYRKHQPCTAIMLDDGVPEGESFGRLPVPESAAEEAVTCTRTLREALNLSDFVQRVSPGPLPPTDLAFDGVDQFVLASGRIAHDPAGMQALRHWLEQGGHLWVMLDLVEPEALTPLLGDTLDFQVVDRTSLTNFTLQTTPSGPSAPAESAVEEHDRPVAFVRVLLPGGERVRHTVNGWPAWFTRQVGRGKVFFTTLGARAWFRPRTSRDNRSPYPDYPSLPIAQEALALMAGELQVPPEESPPAVEAFRPLLTEEIGYAVLGRGTVLLIFGAFLLVALVLLLALRRARRPELLGWLAPAAALGAAAVFVVLGGWSRRAAPPTVATVQVVDPAPGNDEAALHGLLAVYRPESGPVEVGAEHGGFFHLDMAGIEGQTRRRLVTDQEAWHWEGLTLPAGVRSASFQYTAATEGPIVARAHFGPDGLRGTVTPGPFQDLADALLTPAGGRNLAVRLQPDGTFHTGSQDVLPRAQFLAGSVLSDRQQRRQRVLNGFLEHPAPHLEGRDALLVWAKPIDMHFQLAPGARTVGDALLVLPLQLERCAPGTPVTIPGPLLPYRRIVHGGSVRPPPASNQPMDLLLRFQLPRAVLPFEVERARLVAKVSAPSRQVTVNGWTGDAPVVLQRVDSPLDPIRVEITEPRLLRLDAEGGLHVDLKFGDTAAPEKWSIDYIELEVSGRIQ